MKTTIYFRMTKYDNFIKLDFSHYPTKNEVDTYFEENVVEYSIGIMKMIIKY